ncbi:MAG: glutamate dehydrogenase, partial [Patescibacteria group bacterium]
AVYVLEELLKAIGQEAKNSRVAIQGFGNAGYFTANLLDSLGYKIVAISDSQGGVYNADGISPAEAMQAKAEQGSVAKSAQGQAITNEDVLTCDCDILVPAALDNQIREDNAANIKAKIILEVANGAITSVADKILANKGIVVAPDVLTNAGGVTVSYFEWVQNRTGYYWTEEEVFAKLKPIMAAAFNNIWQIAQNKKINLREAAFILAVDRIVKAMRLRGRITHNA